VIYLLVCARTMTSSMHCAGSMKLTSASRIFLNLSHCFYSSRRSGLRQKPMGREGKIV
jgi:hypothetical protein